MAEQTNGVWASVIAALAALPPIGVAAVGAYKLLGDIKGAAKVKASRGEEDARAATARASLDDVQKEWFDGMRADLKEARAENEHLRKDRDAIAQDRDRGWDLARGWREIARDERHERCNLLQRDRNSEMPPPLPKLEEIEGKRSQ